MASSQHRALTERIDFSRIPSNGPRLKDLSESERRALLDPQREALESHVRALESMQKAVESHERLLRMGNSLVLAMVDEQRRINDTLRAFFHGVVSNILADYRPAIESGDLALTIVALELCERWKVQSPAWLDTYLAAWARNYLRNAPRPKTGRPKDLASKLETLWTHELIHHFKRTYNVRCSMLEVTAEILHISPEGAKARMREARRYPTQKRGAHMIGHARGILDMTFPELRDLLEIG